MAQGVFSPPVPSSYRPPLSKTRALSILTTKTEDSFLYALSSNNAWAGYKAHQNPGFFPKLASGQSPQIRNAPLSLFSLPPPSLT